MLAEIAFAALRVEMTCRVAGFPQGPFKPGVWLHAGKTGGASALFEATVCS